MLRTFKKIPGINKRIAEAQHTIPGRRQVVAVVLGSPDKQAVCLQLSRRACDDGFENWSPPQGEIESGEELFEAAVRESYEELRVGVDGTEVEYLGSILRRFEPSHPRYGKFASAHYHWVYAQSLDYEMTFTEGKIAAADWWRPSMLLSPNSSLKVSDEKHVMFMEALKVASERPLRRVPEWWNGLQKLAA